ncbi:MAG: PAS domain S-box protein [Candidatus Aminicenantes bacterium]|nr:PAS domain S-box protein [Candidatus Aminicenantes bacterium]
MKEKKKDSDIAERKRADEALRESEKKYRLLIETADESIVVAQDGLLKFVNPAALGLLEGYSEQELMDRPFTEFIHPDDRSMVVENYRRRIANEAVQPRYAFRVVARDGIIKWVEINAALIEWQGKPATLNFFTDITERKRAEEALRESEVKYSSYVENAPDGVFVVDGKGHYLGVNKAACLITGFAKEELLQLSIHDLLPEESLETGLAHFKALLEIGVSKGESQFKHKDGSKRWWSVDAVKLTETRFLGFAKDITERKRTEEALRESEERYRALFDRSLDCVYIHDFEGRFIDANDAALNLFGYKREEIRGLNFTSLLSEDQVSLAFKALQEIRETGFQKDLTEYRLRLRNGNDVYVETKGSAILSEGTYTAIQAIARDITKRKRAEEEIRRKSKELQEKNDELNRITYAVSHDLRSPLVTIQTFQEHLEQDVRSQDAARVKKDLGYIRSAADKMGRLLDEIRRLSRVGRIVNPSEEAPLQAIVKEALDLVAGRITARGVQVDLTEEPVVLYGDRMRLVEVFQNLVDNAAKFMGGQPAPRVEIGVEQAGEELVLYVRDNGIGIGPEVQPLIFGLFHKLDPGSEGEGIGLALVKRIVELHGGRIWLESEGSGQGTTFRFTLAKTRCAAERKNPP